MNEVLFPATVFTAGYLVYLCAGWLANKSSRGLVWASGSLIMLYSLLLFWQKDYTNTLAILACFFVATLIMNHGLDFSFSSEQEGSGPFKDALGKEGIALSVLDPRGKVEVAGKILPASSEGLFIAKGDAVKVIRVSSKIVIVEKLV